MAAHESLGPQFYHSTNSELKPGDVIQPGHRRDDDSFHFSDDFKELGHHNFTWMTTEKPGVYGGKYGKNSYEVEPLGLHHPYSFQLAKSGERTTTERMQERSSGNDHRTAWVSLAGAKVIRKVGDDQADDVQPHPPERVPE